MKKCIILIVLHLLAAIASAQNYQCIQGSVKHYFINGNGYLRGIRIDSTRIVGDTTFYFPFHTPRGTNPDFLDNNGGSWLGKKIMQLSDGTFFFDNLWGDTVIIKTQANTGDSWIFYNDAGKLYYRATIMSIDTMSIASSINDSVKKISISAYNDTGRLTADPLDGFEIFVSKNYGFVQVCDLYTFPYHIPGDAFTPRHDYYMDKATLPYDDVTYGLPRPRDRNNSIFMLTDCRIPTEKQLHDWRTGDVYESKLMESEFHFSAPAFFVLDTVSGSYSTGGAITYTKVGNSYPYMDFEYPWIPVTAAGDFPFDDNYRVVSYLYMPEELFSQSINYYFPDDTGYCMNSPAYVRVYNNVQYISAPLDILSYKLGIGLTNTHLFNEFGIETIEDLVYYNRQGHECGTYHEATQTQTSVKQETATSFILSPNPVADKLHISNITGVASYRVVTSAGIAVMQGLLNSSNNFVNMESLPSGLYFIFLGDANRNSVYKIVKN